MSHPKTRPGSNSGESSWLRFILDRNQKLQADLVDQLFNSSEKRLARILMTLASVGLHDQSNIINMPITQETLANMVGTTRSRISQFMTKFRKLGYIDYDGQIRVHHSLLNIILDSRLHDNVLAPLPVKISRSLVRDTGAPRIVHDATIPSVFTLCNFEQRICHSHDITPLVEIGVVYASFRAGCVTQC